MMSRILTTAVGLLLLSMSALAGERHPAIRLLDREGRNVLESGRPVSTMATCNGCHRTEYIASHCYHTQLGGGALDALGARNVGGGVEANVELNCFLCHLGAADDQARRSMLSAGRPDWAGTATLAATGLLERQGADWKYRREGFRTDGTADPERLALRPPASMNCGACHGQTHRGDEPLRLDVSLRQWKTATTGTVFAPQRMSDSAANLAGKAQLARSWDVHAERLLECAQCHFSLNHPAYYEPTPRTRPEHLRFEPRRMALDEYLARPSHQFARGESPHAEAANHLEGTMRRCADCHDTSVGHDWLPYREAHFQKLSCEACHIPHAHAPAVQSLDWSKPGPDGQPQVAWRGVEGNPVAPDARITGFTPVLLPRADLDGRERLYPYNLVVEWRRPEGPQSAAPGSGGVGRIVPYALHHGVGAARFALRDCQECHAQNSRLTRPIALAAGDPAGPLPQPAAAGRIRFAGAVKRLPSGEVVWQPARNRAGTYVLGHDRQRWIDVLGGLALLGAFGGAVVHGGLRIAAARKTPGQRES